MAWHLSIPSLQWYSLLDDGNVSSVCCSLNEGKFIGGWSLVFLPIAPISETGTPLPPHSQCLSQGRLVQLLPPPISGSHQMNLHHKTHSCSLTFPSPFLPGHLISHSGGWVSLSVWPLLPACLPLGKSFTLSPLPLPFHTTHTPSPSPTSFCFLRFFFCCLLVPHLGPYIHPRPDWWWWWCAFCLPPYHGMVGSTTHDCTQSVSAP